MQRHAWRQWGAAGLSAGLLELPFPLAGPMPPWRSIFAWFGLFGLALMLVRGTTGRTAWALLSAPFLWTALDLLAARFTSVPWDQLGYSQVDNALVARLAPWTGVYGITFLLVAVNCFFASL